MDRIAANIDMKRIIVTQRVCVDENHGERRDALDQRWSSFLHVCGLTPVLAPNNVELARSVIHEIKPDGILLTGGGDLAPYGGDAPERDATENMLLDYAIKEELPLLGVCRGMQAIQNYFGARLARVEGHVAVEHEIVSGGVRETVNSYHNYGTTEASPGLETWAVARDGVVEGVKHDTLPVTGVMWHPERYAAFRSGDIMLFNRVFGGAVAP